MAGSSLARQKGKRAVTRRLEFSVTHVDGISRCVSETVNVVEIALRVDVAQSLLNEGLFKNFLDELDYRKMRVVR